MAKDSLKHVDTMIGADAAVRGDLVLKGGAIICGKVYGNVVTKGAVRIARNAFVRGDVIASDAFVGGVVEGNLTTQGKVVLRSHATVSGDIVYRKLVIEEGAHFEGRCDVLPVGLESRQHEPEKITRVRSRSAKSPKVIGPDQPS